MDDLGIAIVIIAAFIAGAFIAHPGHEASVRSSNEIINQSCVDYGKYVTDKYSLVCSKKEDK